VADKRFSRQASMKRLLFKRKEIPEAEGEKEGRQFITLKRGGNVKAVGEKKGGGKVRGKKSLRHHKAQNRKSVPSSQKEKILQWEERRERPFLRVSRERRKVSTQGGGDSTPVDFEE